MHSNGEKTKLGRIGKQELNVSSDCDVNFGVQSGIYHNEASCRRNSKALMFGNFNYLRTSKTKLHAIPSLRYGKLRFLQNDDQGSDTSQADRKRQALVPQHIHVSSERYARFVLATHGSWIGIVIADPEKPIKSRPSRLLSAWKSCKLTRMK